MIATPTTDTDVTKVTELKSWLLRHTNAGQTYYSDLLFGKRYPLLQDNIANSSVMEHFFAAILALQVDGKLTISDAPGVLQFTRT